MTHENHAGSAVVRYSLVAAVFFNRVDRQSCTIIGIRRVARLQYKPLTYPYGFSGSNG